MTVGAARPLALTMGEPAGIGGEIALKAWMGAASGTQPVAPFFVIDDPDRLAALAQRLGWRTRVEAIDRPAQAGAFFPRALPVLPVKLPRKAAPGRPDPANAPAVLKAIEHAVALAEAGEAGAVVTNPIHKRTLADAGFRHPGHTEYLAEIAGRHAGRAMQPVMMLACPGLRVVPVTVHVPLAEAARTLSRAAIVAAGRTTAAALIADFGIVRPRLAVAGLNPHAGEEGRLGREEIEVIAPAVADLAALGLTVTGPHPADSLFHAHARHRFDAAICMYHDQALIPLKTIDFERGINITLGLPFVRTSPDHGTAFDIAGTGRARETSLVAALNAAAEMAARRAAAHERTPVA